jgi:general secretion pathway protein D
MKIIKDIVSKLDVVLAQVLIEAVIIQVTLLDNTDVGFNYIMRRGQGDSYLNSIGAIKTGNVFNRNVFGSEGTNNLLPSGFTYLASLGQDLDVTVSALAGSSRAKVLQRPRLQTSHNEPANLFVGESRPYPTGSYYGGGAYGGYSSIQQLPIGVSLNVTPLINPDGLVVMQIDQSVDSVNGTVTIANVGDVPITSQKQASTKVSVRDRDTIVLGGMIEDQKSKSVAGVPLLKDIPLLGYLFRSNSEKNTRNELIVLIRPTVLPTPEVAALAARKEVDNVPLIKQFEAETKAEDAKRIRKTEQQMQKDGLQ